MAAPKNDQRRAGAIEEKSGNRFLDRRLIRIGLALCCALLAILLLARMIGPIFGDRGAQWDVRAYYFAAQALALGENPYDDGNSTWLAPEHPHLPFVYPPYVLPLFSLLAKTDLAKAKSIYLSIKLVLLAIIIIVWWRGFAPRNGLLLLLLLPFAFNAALYSDLLSGNISLLEQFLLWFGFYFLSRGKPVLFCVLLVLASLFKLILIPFLALLWFIDDARKRRLFVISFTVFLVIQGITYFATPEWYALFLRRAVEVKEYGKINPSSLALFHDLLDKAATGTQMPWPNSIHHIVYLLFVLAVGLVSLRFSKQLMRSSAPGAVTRLICFACFTFALVAPRFKDYSYVLLILPAAYVIAHLRNIQKLNVSLLFLALFVVTVWKVPWGFEPFYGFLADYGSFFLACMLWALFLVYGNLSSPIESATDRSD